MKTTPLILLILFTGTLLHAEGNSLSQSIVDSTVVPGSAVQADPKTDNRGREYKAGDAQNQGKTGEGIAIATASTLMSRAIPLLMSLNPFEVAAGADLMAKGGLEIGQAVQDAKTAQANGGQKKLLTNGIDESQPGNSSSSSKANNPASALNTPELDNMLASRGINADDFKNQLASGALSNPTDLLKAIGNTMDISPEDFEKGKSLADSQFSSINGSDSQTNSESNSTASNENSYEENANGASASGGSSASGNTAGISESGVAPVSSSANPTIVLSKQGTKPSTQGESSFNLGATASSLFQGLFGNHGANSVTVANAQFASKELAKIGILKPLVRGMIFQTAHRNYRSFGKWRRNTTVATLSR